MGAGPSNNISEQLTNVMSAIILHLSYNVVPVYSYLTYKGTEVQKRLLLVQGLTAGKG